jgi:hypothetical protein
VSGALPETGLQLAIVYDALRKKLNLVPKDEATRKWQESDDLAIADVMNGLAAEQPTLTESLLEEIALRLGRRAQQVTGQPMVVEIIPGRIEAKIPAAFEGSVERLLEGLRRESGRVDRLDAYRDGIITS